MRKQMPISVVFRPLAWIASSDGEKQLIHYKYIGSLPGDLGFYDVLMLESETKVPRIRFRTLQDIVFIDRPVTMERLTKRRLAEYRERYNTEFNVDFDWAVETPEPCNCAECVRQRDEMDRESRSVYREWEMSGEDIPITTAVHSTGASNLFRRAVPPPPPVPEGAIAVMTSEGQRFEFPHEDVELSTEPDWAGRMTATPTVTREGVQWEFRMGTEINTRDDEEEIAF